MIRVGALRRFVYAVGKDDLIGGVGQRMNAFSKHAVRSRVNPGTKFEYKIERIADCGRSDKAESMSLEWAELYGQQNIWKDMTFPLTSEWR